jgi:hypothetical protein
MRFVKGDKRDCAPMRLIVLLQRTISRLERFRRLAKGDNRDYAPISPKSLLPR